MHHIGICPIALAFGIDFDVLLALDRNFERIRFVAFAKQLDADFVPSRYEFEVAALLVAIDEEFVFALAFYVNLALRIACVLKGETSHIELRLIVCGREDNFIFCLFIFPNVRLHEGIQ